MNITTGYEPKCQSCVDGYRCEFCGRENHSIVDNGHGKMIKVVLTIAHLNHTPEDCRPENLRALCQRCHNRYDAKHRAETRKNNKK